MAKTITIRDDVYDELAALRGRKSFSEAIEELIRRTAKMDRDLLLKYFGISKNFPEVERRKEVRTVEILR